MGKPDKPRLHTNDFDRGYLQGLKWVRARIEWIQTRDAQPDSPDHPIPMADLLAGDFTELRHYLDEAIAAAEPKEIN